MKRVTKWTARKAYNNGKPVILCPCKLNPYFCHSQVQREDEDSPTFEQVCNSFSYYNCTTSKVGRHIAYYLDD